MIRDLLYFLSIGPATWLYNNAPFPDWYAELYVAFYAPLFRLAAESDLFQSVLRAYLWPWQ